MFAGFTVSIRINYVTASAPRLGRFKSLQAVKPSTMGYIGIALLTVLQLASAATLQFVSPPPDRSITLYSAPPSYNQVPGKPTMNTIIIKSDSAKSNDSRSSNLTSVMTKWKRNLFVSRNDKEIKNYDNVGTERNLPQYSIDCTEEKSCSETITVEPTPTPTFKPYSQEELEAFLKEYAAAQDVYKRQRLACMKLILFLNILAFNIWFDKFSILT